MALPLAERRLRNANLPQVSEEELRPGELIQEKALLAKP